MVDALMNCEGVNWANIIKAWASIHRYLAQLTELTHIELTYLKAKV
jgi:hypothetical protein